MTIITSVANTLPVSTITADTDAAGSIGGTGTATVLAMPRDGTWPDPNHPQAFQRAMEFVERTVYGAG